MTIITYTARAARKVRGTNVEKGQTLYAIQKNNLYFIWSYSDLAFAKLMDGKLSGPEDNRDRGANWRKNLDDLCPSGRTEM